MRITAKGQVTIPREIREKTGLLPETEVEFEVRDSEVIIKKAGPGKTTRLGPYLRVLRGSAEISLSTDEIMKLTRGDDDGDD
ncbi:MAG: AbrB/MazE/SpoVT family DNA-binding domain-containing protein [Spirochaetia bacterium]